MRNTILLIFLYSLVNTQSFAQSFQDESEIAVKKGDVLLTGFLSYPNWPKFIASSVLESADLESSEVKGIAPLGLKFEYMLSNEFGFTLDGIYNSWSGEWVPNSDSSPKSIGFQRYRVQIGINYHMSDLESTDLDLYGGFGIGTNRRDIDRSDFIEFSQLLNLIDNPIVNVPISFRFRLGARYFLFENVAVNFELATGGPFLSGGLTFLLN